MPAGSFVSAIPVAHMFCTEQILYPSWGYNDKVQSNETHAREVKKKKKSALQSKLFSLV